MKKQNSQTLLNVSLLFTHVFSNYNHIVLLPTNEQWNYGQVHWVFVSLSTRDLKRRFVLKICCTLFSCVCWRRQTSRSYCNECKKTPSSIVPFFICTWTWVTLPAHNWLHVNTRHILCLFIDHSNFGATVSLHYILRYV